MKAFIFFCLVLFSACSVDCPVDCLESSVEETYTKFTLPYTPNPGEYYYLSLQLEGQGIINLGFPASGVLYYSGDLNCEVYDFFVLNTQSTSMVSKTIEDFYNGVQGDAVIDHCKDVVPCK